MVPADLPWLHDLCREKYDKRYDAHCTAQWFLTKVLPDPWTWYAVRTDNAFVIAFLFAEHYAPGDIDCNIRYVCADDGKMWEAIHLLRDTIAWAQSRNCKSWNLAGDTDKDLRSIAFRLGAKEIWPRYKLILR